MKRGCLADAAPSSSFLGEGAEPESHQVLDLGAVLIAELGEPLVELGIAIAGALRNQVPFEAFDDVDRRTPAGDEDMGEPVLGDRAVLFCGPAEQLDGALEQTAKQLIQTVGRRNFALDLEQQVEIENSLLQLLLRVGAVLRRAAGGGLRRAGDGIRRGGRHLPLHPR